MPRGAPLTAAVEQDTRDVRLNLGEVTFIDSSGIRLLALVNQQLAGLQRRLIVTHTSAPAARFLALSGMAEVLGVEPTSADPGP